MHRNLLAAAILAFAATPALAQEHPAFMATRDVEVIYKTLGHNAGRAVTISQSAQNALMRLDGAAPNGYVIVDRTHRTSTVVMTAQHMYMQMVGTTAPGQQPIPTGEGSFARTGSDTIAGLACTIWTVTDKDGRISTICLTADGVLLRALSKTGDGLEATKVTYAAQPADKFTVPDGFQKMELPAGIGAPGAGGPAGHGFSLPPGVKLPPGVSPPPGMTLPQRP